MLKGEFCTYSATVVRVRCYWKKYRELVDILTVVFKLKEKIYAMCENDLWKGNVGNEYKTEKVDRKANGKIDLKKINEITIFL